MRKWVEALWKVDDDCCVVLIELYMLYLEKRVELVVWALAARPIYSRVTPMVVTMYEIGRCIPTRCCCCNENEYRPTRKKLEKESIPN